MWLLLRTGLKLNGFIYTFIYNVLPLCVTANQLNTQITIFWYKMAIKIHTHTDRQRMYEVKTHF